MSKRTSELKTWMYKSIEALHYKCKNEITMELNKNGATHGLEEAPLNNKSDFKNNNIPPKKEQEDFGDSLLETPLIPECVYEMLPEILHSACKKFDSGRERDLFLTGALVMLSGALNKIIGVYNQKVTHANLFMFVVAPAASGKGALTYAKDLLSDFHKKLKNECEQDVRAYNEAKEAYLRAKKLQQQNENLMMLSEPVVPKQKLLFIPGNSSAAAIVESLFQTDGAGIICETEADTLSSIFNQDWGGYSHMLREVFHNETISSKRIKQNLYIEIEKPTLAVALSGTPSQVKRIIESTENGLFSRFIYYAFKRLPLWNNVSPDNKSNLSDYFIKLSVKVTEIVEYLTQEQFEVLLTQEQWNLLNSEFSEYLSSLSSEVSEDIGSTVKRLGLIQFKLCMILTALRKYEAQLNNSKIVCKDEDFLIAAELIKVYLSHAIAVFKMLPKSSTKKSNPNIEVLLNKLPLGKEFTLSQAIEIGASLGFKERTVRYYLKTLVNDGCLSQPLKFRPYRRVK